MTIWEIIGFGMLTIPVVWCFGQLFGALLKMLDPKDWFIIGGVVAWYVAAFVALGVIQ